MNQARNLRWIRQVGWDCGGPPALILYGPNMCLELRHPARGEYDSCASPCELACGRCADAGAGSGHDCGVIPQGASILTRPPH